MSYEQPQHLNELCYKRAIAILRPVLIGFAVLLSALVLFAQWRRAQTGYPVTILGSVMGATIGVWAAGLCWLALRFEYGRRHAIEFREKGLFLSGRGVIALPRIVSWSLSQDPLDSHYTWLRI